MGPCFHGATWTQIEHDPVGRVATLELKLGFPDVTAASRVTSSVSRLLFRGVSHLLAYVSMACPPRQLLPVREHRTENASPKSCVETMSLAGFIPALLDQSEDVLEARASLGPNLSVVEFEGPLNVGPEDVDLGWYRFLIAAESLSVEVNGHQCQLDELLGQGERAWEAWSLRRSTKDSAE